MKKKNAIEEEIIEKEEKEKPIKTKSNSLIVILLILIILVMGVYILNEKGMLPIRTTSEDKQINSIKDNQDEQKEETKQEEIQQPTKPQIEEKEPITGTIDVNKSLNTSGIEYKNLTVSQGDYGLETKINKTKNNVTLTIDWDKFGPIASPIVGGFSWATESKEELTINGFHNKIETVFIGDVGQDATGITLFYIMADGSVEYTKIFVKQFNSQGNLYYNINYHYNYSDEGKASLNGFISAGQIKGVNEVVQIYNATASGGMSGWSTVLAAKQDGSMYDLGNIIMGY